MELMAASLAEVEARLEEDGALRTQLEAEVRLARAALAEATRGLAAVRAAREAVEEARKQARVRPLPTRPCCLPPQPSCRLPRRAALLHPHAPPSLCLALSLATPRPASPRLASP